jgi:hypothetical protein
LNHDPGLAEGAIRVPGGRAGPWFSIPSLPHALWKGPPPSNNLPTSERRDLPPAAMAFLLSACIGRIQWAWLGRGDGGRWGLQSHPPQQAHKHTLSTKLNRTWLATCIFVLSLRW